MDAVFAIAPLAVALYPFYLMAIVARRSVRRWLQRNPIRIRK